MVPLSWRQSKRLRDIADFLVTLDEKSGKYKDLYDLQDDQLETSANFLKKETDKKSKFLDPNNSEPDSDGDDPMEYLQLVKSALFNTRKILEDVDENGSLYIQLWHIFNMFCGKLVNDEENLSIDDSESNLSY